MKIFVAALICELVHKMCYVVLAVLISQCFLDIKKYGFASKICEYNLADLNSQFNLRVQARSTISHIFLLRAPVTQTGITSSRKLGIRIRKVF